MMKPAPPSLESYMSSVLKGNAPTSSTPNPLAAPASGAVMNEMNKLRQLQAKKQELMQQMNLVESQILKTQGALEVLQSLGVVPIGMPRG